MNPFGNPCLKEQLEDPKYVGKMTFGRYKWHECTQLEECSTEQRQMEESS